MPEVCKFIAGNVIYTKMPQAVDMRRQHVRSFVRSCLHAFIQPLLPFVHPSVPHEATSIRSIIGRHTSHQHHTVSKSRYSTGNMHRGWDEERSTSDNNENNLAKMTILYYTRFTTTQDSLCLGKYTIGRKKKRKQWQTRN